MKSKNVLDQLHRASLKINAIKFNRDKSIVSDIIEFIWLALKLAETGLFYSLAKLVSACDELPDKCTCSNAHRDRHMIDPACRYCDYKNIIDALAEVKLAMMEQVNE